MIFSIVMTGADMSGCPQGLTELFFFKKDEFLRSATADVVLREITVNPEAVAYAE